MFLNRVDIGVSSKWSKDFILSGSKIRSVWGLTLPMQGGWGSVLRSSYLSLTHLEGKDKFHGGGGICWGGNWGYSFVFFSVCFLNVTRTWSGEVG